MTAILLEIIFTVAISRAFSLPLHDVITGDSPISPLQLSPSVHQIPNGSKEAVGKNESETNSCDSRSDDGCDGVVCSLSCGQSQIVTLVDAFASTYHAAYRSVQLWLYFDLLIISI